MSLRADVEAHHRENKIIGVPEKTCWRVFHGSDTFVNYRNDLNYFSNAQQNKARGQVN